MWDIDIKRIDRGTASDFLRCFHYLGGGLQGKAISYGVFSNNVLVGIVSFVDNELSRFALIEDAPKNSASHILSKISDIFFKDNCEYDEIYSFADGGVGHTGGIYKAAGWELDEVQKSIAFVATDDEGIEHVYSGKYVLERAYKNMHEKGILRRIEKYRFIKKKKNKLLKK
jgi:hypothetical protein